MKLKFVLGVLIFVSNLTIAQLTCDKAVFIKDSVKVINVAKPNLWLKFKAKGAVLNLTIVSASTGDQLQYTMYPLSDCNRIDSGLVKPTRHVGTGLSVLTDELWQVTVDKGICVCDNCLSKVKLSPNRNLVVEQEKMYLLKIHANGQTVKITSKWFGIDNKKKVFDLNSPSETLEIGMTFQLKMVQFVASRTDYLNKETPQELDSLYQFLSTNESVNILIEGHVNGPTKYKQEHFMQLSSDRAKKIKDYLINRGINKSRVNSIGKSNTAMRYPSPKTEWEAQQNRRVEVKIVSL